MQFVIKSATSLYVSDSEINELLTHVYVNEGYVSIETAETLFDPSAVRNRGHLICGRPKGSKSIAGLVIVVFPDSAASRLAKANEAEMHLLAVAREYRGKGLGRALVLKAVETAREYRFQRMVLWTQPSMGAAQKLYTSLGFNRNPVRDPVAKGKKFLFFEMNLLSI